MVSEITLRVDFVLGRQSTPPKRIDCLSSKGALFGPDLPRSTPFK